MSSSLRCLNCGLTFAAFGGPEAAVRAYSAHPCNQPPKLSMAGYPGMAALARRVVRTEQP